MTEAAEYTFSIRNMEINLHNRLSFTALANILQECASRHAAHLGVSTLDLMRAGQTWVLSKLQISMVKAVGLGEKLIIKTWPAGDEGVKAYRDFRIFNQQKEQIGTAVSIWLIIDMIKRKVVPLPDTIAALRTAEDIIPYDFRKNIQIPEKKDYGYQTKAGWYELDINRHVNNNHFLRWIIESFPLEFLTVHRMTDVELVFLGECHYGDAINVHTSEDRKNHYLHSIDKGAGNILMMAATTWESI